MESRKTKKKIANTKRIALIPQRRIRPSMTFSPITAAELRSLRLDLGCDMDAKAEWLKSNRFPTDSREAV